MLGLVLGGVITFAVSLPLACMMLRWRCRGTGPPFGPRARYWAGFIVVATASAAAAVGVLCLAGGHVPAYIGILVPGGLALGRLPPRRDQEMLPRGWPGLLTSPFSRLYDRMGEDLQDWCDTRIEAARAGRSGSRTPRGTTGTSWAASPTSGPAPTWTAGSSPSPTRSPW